MNDKNEKIKQTWIKHDEYHEFHNELFYTNYEYVIHEVMIMLLNVSNKHW